jgi:peptidyl-prolyl cis-trans isomerase D
MTSENKDKKKTITKIIVGIFLTFATAGFIFSDMQFGFNQSNNPVILTINEHDIRQSDILQERDGLIQHLGSIPQNNQMQQKLISRALDNVTLRTSIIVYAELLGIEASDIEIADTITSIDAFKGVNGEFDKMAFKNILQNQKVSIGRFKKNIAKNIIQAKFTEPLEIEFPIASKIAQTFNQFADTKINISVYNFSFDDLPKDIKEIKILNDEQLNKVYNEKLASLKKPALKNIDYILFNDEYLADKIKITDEMIEKFYNENQKTLYTKEEERKVLQIVIDDEKRAKKIFKTLDNSVSVGEVAKSLGYDYSDIDLGYIKLEDLDTQISKQLFQANLGQILNPIKTDFGYAIYYIEAIKPQKIQTLENVKQDIEKKLFDKKLSAYLLNIRIKIEDDIAGGASFSEITQKYGSKVQSQENITNKGEIYLDSINDKDGTYKSVLNPLIPIEYVNDYFIDDEVPIIELKNNQFGLLKITQFVKERP